LSWPGALPKASDIASASQLPAMQWRMLQDGTNWVARTPAGHDTNFLLCAPSVSPRLRVNYYLPKSPAAGSFCT